MGVSASSLLDETRSGFIRDQAEAELKAFEPYYRKQFWVARFCQVEDDLEQQKEKITQLLKQREAPEEGEVLYEEGVLYFDETRKWRDRYVVVRANYCLECHDSLESFCKGVPPRQKLLPTGGAVLTTEESYMAMVDKCFPDDSSVKEDFAPPLSGMPGQFPVYLRLPYRRDSYFCFKQQAKHAAFLSILSDCIRHQNQDFLKKKTCEVQAFLKAIQLYRQDKGKYEAWNMLIGSDVRVMANLVMEQLLPSLEKDMLPRLKAKKTEKKRVWFATVEEAYILVQEHLLDGLSALKEECRTSSRQLEVLIHSDMDQIISSRKQLEQKIRGKVSEPAEKLSAEAVQPYLGSVLEELMEPISSGFQEGRQLSESMMNQVCQDRQLVGDNEQLKKALADMAKPNLLSCYQKIGSLQEKLQHLQERFAFSNITGVIHSAQIDLQQLMVNAVYTFEQLLHKAVQDNPDNAGSAIEKAKHRVLKQYDYDSSTVRKRLSREALVSITLPFIKKNLAPTCKTELQDLEPSIYTDHAHFIHVENVYESILLEILDKEVTKVVKEAASLKKYNLFTDSRDLLSQSSRSSLSSPSVSTPSSPAMALASPAKKSSETQPPSPLAVNSVSSSPQKEEQQENVALQSEASTDAIFIETPLGKVEQTEAAPSVAAGQEAEAPDVNQTVKAEEPETPAPPETTNQSETAEENVEPETVIREEVTSVEAETAETQSADAPKDAEITSSETPTVRKSETIKTDAEAAQTEAAAPSPDPPAQSPQSPDPPAQSPQSPDPPAQSPDPSAPSPDPSAQSLDPPAEAAEDTGSASCSEEKTNCGSSEIKSEAPSSGEAAAVTPADVSLDPQRQEAEPVAVSDPNSLDVSVGSESAPSDVESSEDVGATTTQSSEDEVSTTSDVLEDVNLSKSPVSSDDPPEDKTTSDEPSPRAETEAASADICAGADIEAGASVSVAEAPPDPKAEPLDSIKAIRDLVVEVIEVEELVQRYPDGIPKQE